MYIQMASIRLMLFSWILVLCFIKSCFGLWYMGCYTELESSNFTLYGNSTSLSSGVACSSLCYSEGFLYAAVSNGAECKCNNVIEGVVTVNNSDSCSIRCLIGYGQVCGGNSSLSIYSVNGPFIRDININSEHTLVQENTQVYIQAQALFADNLDSLTGLPQLNNSLQDVQVRWLVNASVIKEETYIVTNQTILLVAVTHRFQQQGLYVIDVEVENRISTSSRSINLTVVEPAPRNLQVLLKASPDSVPSCIPVEDSFPVNLPSVAVFLNEEVTLQASVSMGTNLTFVWEFEDGSTFVVSPYLVELECLRITCMQQHIKNHTFTTEGVEKVKVNVSNSLGSLTQELYVVVVKRQLSNLSVSVDDPLSSYFIKPNTVVTFSLNLFTTARQHTYLEIDFGDGRRFNSSLQEENNTFIVREYSESAPNLRLVADYGEGCTLYISFQHKYQNSGVYSVTSAVSSKDMILKKSLEKPIIIQNVISNSHLVANSSYAIGSVSKFFVMLTPSFNNTSSNYANTTFFWELSLQNSSIVTDYTREPFFTEVFTEVGRYSLSVNVSNLVSFDYTKEYFIVQEPIEELLINTTTPDFISLGGIVHVVASIKKGTNVTFRWDFGEMDVYVTPSPVTLANRYQERSTANYTYWEVGTYAITVTANNLVSQNEATLSNVITVEQQVSGFSLKEILPTILGDTTEIFAVLKEGTHVRFTIDIGRGAAESVTASEVDDGFFKFDYVFNVSGVYHVVITAFNDVSFASDELSVIVQANIDDIQVIVNSDVIIHQVSQFLVKNNNGEILDRSDLLYQWTVDAKNLSSALPFFTYTFHTTGLFELEVLVSNLVATKKLSVNVEVLNTVAPVVIYHSYFVEAKHPVLFQLMNNVPNVDDDDQNTIEIDFGDGHSAMLDGNSSEPLQFSHTYDVAGLYQVNVSAFTTNVHSVLSVQEQISNISLQGPTITRFYRPESMQIWNVARESGTAILYTWTTKHLSTAPGYNLQSKYQMFTNVLQKECLEFAAAGVYDISVNASNHISWQTINIQTQLQEPILSTSVYIPTVVHGQNSTIEISVQGERPFTFDINYGDGKTGLYFSEDLMEKVFVDSGMYTYRYTLNKHYLLDGEYTCFVVINNTVSSRSVTVRGVVEEKISGVRIMSDSPSILQLGEVITLIATVDKGSNIIFEWNFRDQISGPYVESLGNMSIATHTFNLPGSYNVTVSVSNALQTEPITVAYPETLQILEAINSLWVSPKNDRYTTSLHIINNITMRTDQVKFHAECSGTEVTFVFNFGDGSPLITRTGVNKADTYTAETVASHVYQEEGSYMVTLTAFNAVSNSSTSLPQPFLVQIPPLGLSFERSHHETKFGEYTNLTVLVNGGSDLKFYWSMGDQTTYPNHGMSVSHKYFLAKDYTVTVTASNNAENVTVQCTVSVQVSLQGVSLSVIHHNCQNGSNNVLICKTDEKITFEAETITSGTDVWYDWNMGDGSYPYYSRNDRRVYDYNQNGRYTVTVKASNANSNVVSEPISLWLQTPVRDLSIRHKGTSIVNAQTSFQALVHDGSDLTYTWNFGDGAIETTSTFTTSHTYNRTGEYVVSVEVGNSLGQVNASSNHFVLTQECKLPSVKFVGDKPRKVNRSDAVEIETDIYIECDITMQARYMWTIKHVNNTAFTHYCGPLNLRNLFLMKQCIPFGIYIVTLEVRINGTIVYTRETLELHILKKPLVAIIEGGTYRFVGNNSQVVLSANYSYDPNEPVNGIDHGLRYRWGCKQLSQPDLDCFISNQYLINATSIVFSFDTSFLKKVIEPGFVFYLRVSKDDHLNSQTSQVIAIQEPYSLQVMVECLHCTNGVLNSNDELSLEAHCPNCGVLTYQWTIYGVLDGAGTDTETKIRCVPPNGGTPQFLMAGNQTVESQTTENNLLDSHSHSTPLTPSVSTEMANIIGDMNTDEQRDHTVVTLKPKTTIADPNVDYIGVDDSDSRPLEESLEESIKEDSYIRGSHSTTTVPNAKSSPSPPAPQGDDNTDDNNDDYYDESDESILLEEDEGDIGLDDYDEEEDTDIEETGTDHSTGGDSDESSDKDEVTEFTNTPLSDSIFLKKLHKHIISADELSTTLVDRSLVVKGDYFNEGKTYAISVQVTNRDGQVGNARYYFKVNTNPGLGKCTVFPSSGTELTTKFTINCVEWQDEHLPLYYEISYGLRETDDMTIIYNGMNQNIKFTLPSGLAEEDHKVYIHIAIIDHRGGRTNVCLLPIEVLPTEYSVDTTEEYLYNKTVVAGNELQDKIVMGLPQDIYHFTNTIAHMLNRLIEVEHDDAEKQSALTLRREIREHLLKAVENIPNRNLYEMHIAISSVDAVCQKPSELTLDAIKMATDIVRHVTGEAISQKQGHKHLLQHSVSAASGLLSAMPHIDNTLYSVKNRIAQTIIEATYLHIKLQLNELVVNQFPTESKSPVVNTFMARLDKVSSLTVEEDSNQFTLPSNMDVILGNQTKSVCWDVSLVTYTINPYQWNPMGTKVTTGVSSLDLFTCDGKDLVVENLNTEHQIHLSVPHDLSIENSEPGNFTFDKANMNIHEFNVTDDNMQQTLHFTLEFFSTSKRELLPLRLVLRWREEPTPYEYDLKWDYDDYENSIEQIFQPGFFNETGTYYLALLDSAFDETKYQFEYPPAHYLLRIWWAECLFWNQRKEIWSPDGCELLPTSTYKMTSCRCNHLTAFGISFIPVSKLLHRISMSVFQIPNENPITFVFVLVTFGIYFVLFVYCRYADLHDEKKQGTIFLKDNQPTDQQYYEITIETGFRSGATSTAAISIVLHGEQGYSETKQLKAADKVLFERNSRDRFIASVPESLGHLTKVHIWHNNAGNSPSWFLSRVAVRDLMSGQKWYFICERWLAVEEDDGKIERDIPVQETGIGFQKAFFAKGAQYFSDYYLWSSVFTRPPYSCFTRIQRLTVCLSILMDFFCINTIWYQLLDKEEVDLGLIDVSGEAVLVGIVTALIAIPINFPIIMFFRRISPKTEHDPKEIYKNIKSSFEPSPDAEVRPILNEKSFELGVIEQTAVNLQSLQNWTTENWIRKQKGSMGAFDTDSGRSSQERVFFDNGSISSGFEEFGDDVRGSTDDTKTSKKNINSTSMSDSGMSSPECHSLDSFNTMRSQHDISHKKLTSPKYMFPHWCLYIAYALCFTIIGISTVVAVYLGYRFNQTKAIYWIQSVYFSFLQCVFITQPAVMAMFTIVKSIRHRNNVSIFDHYDDNVDLLSKREMKQIRTNVFIYGNDISKGVEARQRSRYLRYARPLQDRQIQKAKEKMIKEKNMYAILKDVVIYSFILMCLLWMAYGRDNSNKHSLNKSIFNTYVKTTFTEISSVHEFWTWSQTDLLDGLFTEKLYQSDNETEQGYVMDGDTILLGKASLRQVRVHQNSCRIANVMESHFDSCEGSYSASHEETADYGPKGLGWIYSGQKMLKRYTQWGRMDRYDGGGYVVDLNTTRSAAASQLKELQHNAWIDGQTRMVIVEFTLFNAPYRLFGSVGLLAEMPGTGAIYTLAKIESVLLYRYESNYDYFILLLELLFLLLVAVSGKREVHKAIKMKLRYFKSVWSWVEISMILLSLVYFVMYVYRFAYVTEIIERMKRTFNEEFVDMSFLAFWDQCLRSIIGAVLFVVTIKFLHLLRFNRKVAMFAAVIQQAFKPLIILFVSLLLIQVAFSSVGVLLFGTSYKPFNNMFTTTASIITILVGEPEELDQVQEAHPTLWTIFYISYIVTVFIAFSGLAKAILCCSYRKRKNKECHTVGGREVMQFFWNELLVVFGIRSPQSDEHGTKEELPLEFTFAEIEYQVDELLFRMNALSHQHGLPEKPFDFYGDSDNGMEDSVSFISSEPLSSIDGFLEERLERINHDLYSQNPELRHLIESQIDEEDIQKQLRSQLELEIFRQLQHVRQEENRQRLEQQDSGRDTQSEHTDMPFDDAAVAAMHQYIPQAFVRTNAFGTDYQERNWAKTNKSSGSSSIEQSRDDIKLEEFTDDWTTVSSSYSELKEESSELRKSPTLKELESETSFVCLHLDSTQIGSVGSGNTKLRKRNVLQDIVRDTPAAKSVNKTINVEDFAIPNALFSSQEDLFEDIQEEKTSRTKHSRSDLRNKLRKTKSRGKGKGRNRIEIGDEFLNDEFSSDDDVPVVFMGIS